MCKLSFHYDMDLDFINALDYSETKDLYKLIHSSNFTDVTHGFHINLCLRNQIELKIQARLCEFHLKMLIEKIKEPRRF